MKLQLRFTGGRLTHLSSAIVETLSHHWVYPVQTSLSNIFEGNTLTVKFFSPQYLKCPAREPNMSSASVYPKALHLFLFPLSLLRGITLFSELLWLSREIANFLFFRAGGIAGFWQKGRSDPILRKNIASSRRNACYWLQARALSLIGRR